MAGMTGNTFILYTTEEGGSFHVARCTPEEYEGIKQRREIHLKLWDNVIVEPVLVALLAVVDDNYDFILGSSREDAA